MKKPEKRIFLSLTFILLIFVGFYFFKVTVTPDVNRQTIPAVKSSDIDPNNLPGIQIGPIPWKAEIPSLKERLKTIGLPALPTEGTVLHTHQHLDIYINGKNTEVPSSIGVNVSEGFISPIHTHDTSSIIHVESPSIQTFSLGQFFDVWGVRLTNECIGEYCSKDDKSLRIYINGKIISDNYRDLALQEKQEIVITFGTDKELPSPIPSGYSFPPDY